MLQRIHDSLAKWVIVIVLGLIAFSFIFWGVDFGMTGVTTFAAKVNGEDVPLTDFDQALQQRQTQYLQIYQSDLPEEIRRELRRATIEDLVRATALKQRVEEQGYHASGARLDEAIRGIEAFQIAGEYSDEVAVNVLRNQGLSPAGFREMMRTDLEIGDLQNGIAESTFLTPAEFRRYIELYNQRREVAYALFEPESFTAGITIDDAAIAEHYDNNQASYQTPETVDLEYIEVTLADVAATVEVTEEELRAAYEEERLRFETAEERRSRHILIAVEEGQEDVARTAAEAVIARIRGGEDFAAVAAEVSADAGTKAQGGDLGWNSRGTFPTEFEEALFALEPGAISEPVRTDSGFHVIRLDEVRAGDLQSFEAVRDELAAETQTREAEGEFYDLANELGDAAFDAFDDLAPVAAATNLPVKTVEGFPRTGDPAVFPNSAAVVAAAFADEIVDSGRNSELVELAEDHVLVLRVTEHQVPTTRPLDEVREQIREELVRQRAIELAEEAAQAFLADIEQGRDPAESAAARGGTFNPAAWVTRTDAGPPTEVLSTAFGMPKDAGGAPQREIVALANGGQAVVVLTGVEAGEPSSVAADEREQRLQQLADQAARAEIAGYAGNVRASADVRIPDAILEPPIF
jgi:peptidyl-prolyl cis-trans isomerase D